MRKHQKKHRWPKSVRCQVEAILQSCRAFGVNKQLGDGLIRSAGTWAVYRRELHRFAGFYTYSGGTDLLEVTELRTSVDLYLADYLKDAQSRGLSRQTFKTTLAALGRFAGAHRDYVYHHLLAVDDLDLSVLLDQYRIEARLKLAATSQQYERRGYDDPLALISAIEDPQIQLMALLQYEGGMRAEGVGAPSGKLNNPLTIESLKGYDADPITNDTVGIVESREKGGKRTEHYVSPASYERLTSFLQQNERFEVGYSAYLKAISNAARLTNQFKPGRGTHGLKHNFAEERYHEAVQSGMSHEQALQQVSLETSHYRLRETMTYTRGR